MHLYHLTRWWRPGTETCISKRIGFFGVLRVCFEASDHVPGSLRDKSLSLLQWCCIIKKRSTADSVATGFTQAPLPFWEIHMVEQHRQHFGERQRWYAANFLILTLLFWWWKLKWPHGCSSPYTRSLFRAMLTTRTGEAGRWLGPSENLPLRLMIGGLNISVESARKKIAFQDSKNTGYFPNMLP